MSHFSGPRPVCSMYQILATRIALGHSVKHMLSKFDTVQTTATVSTSIKWKCRAQPLISVGVPLPQIYGLIGPPKRL